MAEFLRIRREALQPDDVGLPRGQRRRTPGLRREEVTVLCRMSTDYYSRLEHGRGPQPSEQMVAAALAERLLAESTEFAELWADHEIGLTYTDHKRLIHPEVGALTLHCQMLIDPDPSQALLVFTATPGSQDQTTATTLGHRQSATRGVISTGPRLRPWSVVVQRRVKRIQVRLAARTRDRAFLSTTSKPR
ncbi:hypothetical protein GCM10009555_098190 [Acrocarpospora macrocephala]